MHTSPTSTQPPRLGSWRLGLRLSGRALRGSRRGFAVFIAAVALGVGALAAVGSLSASLSQAITRQAATILGGDLSFTQPYRLIGPDERELVARFGAVADVVRLRAMLTLPRSALPQASDQPPSESRPDAAASAPDDAGQAGPTRPRPKRLLVALKAADHSYPLYGELRLTDGSRANLEQLAPKDGRPGIFLASELARRAGLQAGDMVGLGNGHFEVRGFLASEPDKTAGLGSLGPSAIITSQGLTDAGLLAPGTQATFETRLRLTEPGRAQDIASQLRESLHSGVRIRLASEAVAGMNAFFNRLTSAMSLVGLCALLLGGLGVRASMLSYLRQRRLDIAVMKAVGASPGRVVATYAPVAGLLALVGALAGAALGGLSPFLGQDLVQRYAGVAIEARIEWQALAVATGYGLLGSLFFTSLPLSSASRLRPALLFRFSEDATWPASGPVARLVALLCAAAMAWLVFLICEARLAQGFFVTLAACMAAFGAVRWIIRQGLRRVRVPARLPTLRLAVRSARHPQSPLGAALASLGLGLTAMCALALTQANFSRVLGEELPRIAPSFFFVDIQPDQLEPFRKLAADTQAVTGIDAVPNLRGRIIRVKDVAIENLRVAEDVSWAARGDRGLTFSGPPPKGSKIVAGSWWPTDYHGEPLVSLTEDVANGFGLTVGDKVTVDVLGRELTATVASLRQVNWLSLGINYVFVFSPGALGDAPMTWLATVNMNDADQPERKLVEEDRFMDAVSDAFPNVTILRVGEVLQDVITVGRSVSLAVGVATLVCLGAGLLVLAQMIRLAAEGRRYESVLLSMLGATRRQIALVFVLELLVVALSSSLAAVILGGLVSRLYVGRYLQMSWQFSSLPVLSTLALACVASALFGLAGLWRVLSLRPAQVLRND